MRRNIDKYTVKGSYTKLKQSVEEDDNDQVQSSAPTPKGLELIDVNGEVIHASIMAKLPFETRVVTSSLIVNDELNLVNDLKADEIVLFNPKTIHDEIVASVYEIPMVHSHCSRWDRYDAANLIVLAVLVVGSGIFSSQILLLAQMLSLFHFWVILSKVMWRRFRPVWLPLYFKIKSGVNDIQADGSFPSGHTVFFVLITTVSFYEPDLFSLHCRIIFVVLAGITAIERVKMGAHFASDVLVGGMVAYGFVAIFYRLDWNENLLYRIFLSDFDYQIRFTLLLTTGQFLAFALNEILQEPVSPLLKETVFENNWRRLPHHKNNNEKNVDNYERPLGPSRDFLAPYLALSAVFG